MQVFTLLDFMTIVRTLPQFVKNNRSVTMIMIDGIHYFDHSDKIFAQSSEKGTISDLNAKNFWNSSASPLEMQDKNKPKNKVSNQTCLKNHRVTKAE